MEQLTLQDIFKLCEDLKNNGIDLTKLPIYISNDDELNGIHCAWFLNLLNINNKSEDMLYLIDMINNDSHNNKLENKGILIS